MTACPKCGSKNITVYFVVTMQRFIGRDQGKQATYVDSIFEEKELSRTENGFRCRDCNYEESK